MERSKLIFGIVPFGRVFLVIALILHLVAMCAGFVRQRTPIQRENGKSIEFVHVAKTAGRSVKFVVNAMGDTSPIDVLHKHSVRVTDVLARNNTAVAVLREPIDRTESAFIFVRSGGFGVRIAPDHALINFNSTDSFIESLSKRTPEALSAVRCEAKMKYCSPAVNDQNGETWDIMKHTSIEFRPQTWWINPPAHRERDVLIICYPDLQKVFTKLNNRLPKQSSLKGYYNLKREVKSVTNRNAITMQLYRQDALLYEKYCGE